MMRQHNIIFDPIPFKGGSKIATSEALALCDQRKVRFTVITIDKAFWLNSQLAQQHSVRIISIKAVPWLSRQVQGLFFWLNQFYFTLVLLFCLSFLAKAHRVIGASGPGVDMAIYLIQRVFKVPVVQFIHGNVACSRSIGWCLTQAQHVFYLPSTKQSLLDSLQRFYTHHYDIENDNTKNTDVEGHCVEKSTLEANQYFQQAQFTPFINGISEQNWPSRSQTILPRCLWAASLLKWKGLEQFVEALRTAHQQEPVFSTICFIKPAQTNLTVSTAPVPLRYTDWYRDPCEFDQIRRQCNIFVSTSENEPFGLSILEALAAGMCVIIPQDGSYWDTVLNDGVNCLKYPPKDHNALSRVILQLHHNQQKLVPIQSKAHRFSQQYRAEQTYLNIVNTVSADVADTDSCSVLDSAKKDL